MTITSDAIFLFSDVQKMASTDGEGTKRYACDSCRASKVVSYPPLFEELPLTTSEGYLHDGHLGLPTLH